MSRPACLVHKLARATPLRAAHLRNPVRLVYTDIRTAASLSLDPFESPLPPGSAANSPDSGLRAHPSAPAPPTATHATLAESMFRRSPPPPPPPPPPPSHAAEVGQSAGIGATTPARVGASMPGSSASAAVAALAHLRAGLVSSMSSSALLSPPSSTSSSSSSPPAASKQFASSSSKKKDSSSSSKADTDVAAKDKPPSAKELKAIKAAEKAHSKRIDEELAAAQAAEKKVVKILLLGPGESGKSTLFKQIQKNYGAGFAAPDRKAHHVIVVQNVLRAIKSLLYHSERLLQRLPFSALHNQAKAATTSVSPSLAESKAFIEHVNLYKLFEGTNVTLEQHQPGEAPAPPSPEISPTNSPRHSLSSSSSSSLSSGRGSAAGGSAFSYSGTSTSLSAAAASMSSSVGMGAMSPPPPVPAGESLINMAPGQMMYAGRLVNQTVPKPSNSASAAAGGGSNVKLNPSGRFVPQVLGRAADGRSAEDVFHEILTHCFLLWQDPGLKCTFENRAHFDFHQLFDSDSYFLHKLSTGALLQPDYVPSDEDLIRVRIRTTAINSTDFSMRADGGSGSGGERIPMRMLDVAGQRSERKKWIPYFQNATAVIFVAALSEYDQVLAEDGKTNRLLESVHLFTEIMNSPWFATTPLVLFLNKCDLFADKLRRVPLNVLYPKYSGSNSYQSACEFLCREFVKRRANSNKVIHIHVVSAIQVDLIKTAMDSVKTMIIEQSLQQAGLLS